LTATNLTTYTLPLPSRRFVGFPIGDDPRLESPSRNGLTALCRVPTRRLPGRWVGTSDIGDVAVVDNLCKKNASLNPIV